MHGLTFVRDDGLLFRVLVLPSKEFAKAYLDMLMEDFKALGYPVSFTERDERYVLKVSEKVFIIGE